MARNSLAIPLDRKAEIMRDVCERVSRGALVKDAAKANGVDYDTVLNWSREPEHIGPYARARESQAHALAEQVISLSDQALGCSAEDVQALRLAVDSRKWLASKIAPRVYGEKVTQEHTGEVQVKAALIHFTRQDLPK